MEEREPDIMESGLTSDERVAEQQEGTGGGGADPAEEAARQGDESVPEPGAGAQE